MNSGIQILTETIIVTALIVKANRFVGFDGKYPDAGEAGMGIAHWDTEQNEHLAVSTLGVYPAESGGLFTVGDELEVAAEGKVIKKSAGVTVARARQNASGADQVVEVFIIPN